jgi:hypothetical protein
LSVQVDVNGTSINYPQTGDTGWGDEATQFAIQTGGAFSKLGLDTGTTVDIPGTLDVTGTTTLDSTLDVDGATQLNSTLDVTGNTNLNGSLDVASTVTIVDDLAVDTDTLFVDVSADRVGINIAIPTEALDVVGNIKSNGSITGSSATLTNLTVDTNVIKTDSTNNRVGINTTTPTEALDVTGNIKQSGVILNADGSATSPSITFTNDTNTGIYRSGTDQISISSNGSEVGRITSTYGGFKGNVIQVQSTALLTTTTFSTSFGDIAGLSVNITPRYTTSKILIMCHINAGRSGDILLYFKLLRDSTDICIGDAASNRTRATTASLVSNYSPGIQLINIPIIFLDSPSTTSQITYKIQARTDVQTGYINQTGTDSDTATYSRTASTITVMEIQQ